MGVHGLQDDAIDIGAKPWEPPQGHRLANPEDK
jgi:hypothetical protein